MADNEAIHQRREAPLSRDLVVIEARFGEVWS